MNNGEKWKPDPDFIGEGFHELDTNIVDQNPPKIRFGPKWAEMSPEDQSAFALKLAHTMNHAAYLIQEERDALNRLCEMKEKQLVNMKIAMGQNSDMLQSEIEKMNAYRHSANENTQRLNARIRELESGAVN